MRSRAVRNYNSNSIAVADDGVNKRDREEREELDGEKSRKGEGTDIGVR